MTDAELNEAVARARGQTAPTHTLIRTAIGHQHVENLWPADVANDPAAWGALLEETRGNLGHNNETGKWVASLRMMGALAAIASDPKPGRALALAFLKAVGR